MKKYVLLPTLVTAIAISLTLGCNPFTQKKSKKLTDGLPVTPKNRLLGEYASPGVSGQNPIIVDGFGLLYGLGDNGCAEPDTNIRAQVKNDLLRNRIMNVDKLIDSSDTAIVQVRANIRPGIRKGETFDVDLIFPKGSEAKSMRGGILYPVALAEMGFEQNGRIHTGTPWSFIEGPVLIDPTVDRKANPDAEKQGVILGRAVSNRDRHFTLVVDEKNRSASVAQELESRINRRFKIPGEAKGVAQAKNYSLIEVKMHPDYHNASRRYLAVILSIRCFENETERAKRMEILKQQLLVPETASFAALQLEAMPSKAGADVLYEGLKSHNADVRFCSAESLAFLGKSGIGDILTEIAKTDKPKQQQALMALGVMGNEQEAAKNLVLLLDEKDPDLRYGAFQTLWKRDSQNPVIRGELIGKDKVGYHVLNLNSAPMVHASKTRRAEIVLFSSNIILNGPFVGNAGPMIVVELTSPTEARVVRINPGRLPETRSLPNSLDVILRAIAELGGSYQDMLDFLRDADTPDKNGRKALPCPFVIDALAQEKERTYQSGEEDDEEGKTIAAPKKKSFMQRMNPMTMFEKDKEKSAEKPEKINTRPVDDEKLIDHGEEKEPDQRTEAG
ncbi:MAG: flagellar basal body P-ring protein FlgI [Planctomycetaceae bacterium]|nr:flagellar basal body P-ring protein FlgI [Planctomycetaceae bacterium]